MKKIFLIIFVIIMSIIFPVSAYSNQLVQWSETGFDHDGIWDGTLRINNITAAQDVDIVEFIASSVNSPCRMSNASVSGSGSVAQIWKSGATEIVSGTMYWYDWQTGGAWHNSCKVRFEFNDWNIGGLTGAQTLLPTPLATNWLGLMIKSGNIGMSGDNHAIYEGLASNHANYGQWTSYGNQVLAPVANFTNIAYPKNCYYENEGLDFLDTSENEPTEWFWEIYDNSTSVNVWSSTEESPLWLVDGDPGWYDVQLTVTNGAGSDFLFQPRFFKIGDPGECTYEPRTNITVQPTIQLVPTGVPNLINSTVWKESYRVMGFCNSSMGGACEYYFNATDMFANVVNGTFSNIVGVFTSPLNWVSGAVESVDSDIQTLVTPLIEQSSIFLGIMTRAFIALPAVMVNIVTLGLLIDIVRIVLKGRGSE